MREGGRKGGRKGGREGERGGNRSKYPSLAYLRCVIRVAIAICLESVHPWREGVFHEHTSHTQSSSPHLHA